ncbi:VOC family protein [Leifsonia sp. fls2-241-R2A-40a]|uniref:VOC family protein n=1 Tax=Leifsonia sp. fls2-241-R2A-40a TaxID=3040290 RepID=UPI00254DD61C|nr:VOC family protein [Leifsonia sp. fls2-241-R2A-40a]
MSPRIANVTFFAENPVALARFWSAVMGYPESVFSEEEIAELKSAGLTDEDIAGRGLAWDGDPSHQRFYFTRYRHERRQRNRMHIDITPSAPGVHATRAEVEAERDRLIGLGATVEKVLDGAWGPYKEFAIMMRDPEGNEFCLQ